MDGRSGALAGYELKYQRVSGAGGGGQGPDRSQHRIPAEQGQTVLEGLEKWSWYNLTLAAFTVGGSGPSSPSVLCRTAEDGEIASLDNPSSDPSLTNAEQTPYVHSSRRCASASGRPAAQLLGASGHLAAGVATVTARPDPRLPSALWPSGKRRITEPPPHQRPPIG